jgi:MATE family multidrug resistance protein
MTRNREEMRALLALALPLAGSQVAQMAMSLTDTIMVGRLSTDALAAAGLAVNTAFFFEVAGMGLSASIQPIIAQARGAGDESIAGRTLGGGLMVALIVSAPIILLLLSLGPFFTAIDEPPALVTLAEAYIGPFAAGVPVFLLGAALRNYLAALERTRVVMAVTIAMVFLNLLLNWALVFGHLGLPALGIAGSAYATTISWTIMALLQAAYAWGWGLLPRDLFRLRAAELWAGMVSVLHLGWPISGAWLVEMLLFSGSSLLMGRFGAVALAAHQICLGICSVTWMVPFSVGQAATTRVGFHIGAGDPARARATGQMALRLGIGFMTVMAILLVFSVRPVFGLYLDPTDPDYDAVVAVGRLLIVPAALFQVFDGTQSVSTGALRGLKDTRAAMIVATIGYCGIGLPVGAGLAFWGGLGPVGLWWGFVVGLGACACLNAARFRDKSGRLVAAGAV